MKQMKNRVARKEKNIEGVLATHLTCLCKVYVCVCEDALVRACVVVSGCFMCRVFLCGCTAVMCKGEPSWADGKSVALLGVGCDRICG